MKRLELRIFRFDKDKDYEAYYKPYVYETYENFNALYDLLLQVSDDDIYFDFPKDENAYVLVNSSPFKLGENLEKILQEKGFCLIIEPLSTKRACKDLIFDKNDFLNEFKILESLVSKEDKKLYESLDYLYYTSKILQFNEECFGDSLFAFAFKMLQKYPAKKLEILRILSDKEHGIFYHLPSENENLEQKIAFLKEEILKANLFDKNLLNSKEFKKENFKTPNLIKHDFKGFNIGFFGFKEDNFKNKLKAKTLQIKGLSSGFELLNLNANLAYKIAADIVLEAYDSGCDFLVVDDLKDFYMFDTCSKNLMKESGREFEDFYILNSHEFASLMQGEKSAGLKNHKLKVSLL